MTEEKQRVVLFVSGPDKADIVDVVGTHVEAEISYPMPFDIMVPGVTSPSQPGFYIWEGQIHIGDEPARPKGSFRLAGRGEYPNIELCLRRTLPAPIMDESQVIENETASSDSSITDLETLRIRTFMIGIDVQKALASIDDGTDPLQHLLDCTIRASEIAGFIQDHPDRLRAWHHEAFVEDNDL